MRGSVWFLTLLLFTCPRFLPAQCQLEKFLPPTIDDSDQFGGAIAIEGDVAVVGAFLGATTGLALIFNFDGESWVEAQVLTASDAMVGDRFGESVAIRGDRILVGAPGDDDVFSDIGSAYLFEFNGSEWLETVKFEASDAGPDDEFGNALAVDGDVVAIGSHREDELSFDAGAVYIFRFNGASWFAETKLLASDGDDSHHFGRSLELEGDTLAVGAPGHDELGGDAGAAYVFEFTGDWLETQKLAGQDTSAGDHLGTSVSLEDDLLLVGAPGDDASAPDSGAVHVFEFDGVEFVEIQKVFPADGENGDAFGMSVDRDGPRIVAGAFTDDDLGNGSGSAYLFEPQGTNWVQQAKLTATDGDSLDRFGTSVASHELGVLIGAPRDEEAGSLAGAVYHFITSGAALQTPFVRGDVDADGSFSGLVDTVALLSFGFAGGATPPCLDAADPDGDGSITPLVDGVYLLLHQFASGPPPAAPYPGCAADPDPSDDGLCCESHPGCP